MSKKCERLEWWRDGAPVAGAFPQRRVARRRPALPYPDAPEGAYVAPQTINVAQYEPDSDPVFLVLRGLAALLGRGG